VPKPLQGETREQMIEDVLKSAIESARGAAENVSNDAGIAKKIEEVCDTYEIKQDILRCRDVFPTALT